MGRVPATHHRVLVLASLIEADRHGYAIKKDVAERTANDVRLGSTTLYRILAELHDEGLIADVPSPAGDDPRRRQFRITASGRRWFIAELGRMEKVFGAARSALGRPAR